LGDEVFYQARRNLEDAIAKQTAETQSIVQPVAEQILVVTEACRISLMTAR
jgi:hypothetical protein